MSRVAILIILIGFTESLFPGALDDYSQACMEGEAKGCYQVGAIYRDGLGVRQDTETAKGYFKMACDMGNTQACAKLKDIDQHRNNSSIGTSDTELKEYKEQCLKGDATGCYAVGRVYWDGEGVTEDLVLGKKFFDLACQGGEYWSCLKMAGIYLGAKSLTQKNYNEARKYAKLACDHKIGNGCEILDYMYKNGEGVEKNTQLSKIYFEKSIKYFYQNCESAMSEIKYKKDLWREYAYECLAIGIIYQMDKRVTKDYSKVRYYLDRACELGDPDGCEFLADIYERGEGDKKTDNKKAGEYYQKACDLGNKSLCKQASQLIGKANHFTKEYVLSVIRNGFDRYKGKFSFGTMPASMVNGSDAEYIANEFKGEKPASFGACVGCHGEDGRGMSGMTPNLTK